MAVSWTKKNIQYLQNVQRVLSPLQDEFPLTLRQLYYQLVAGGYIDNHLNEYKKLSRMMTQARMDNLIPWEALEDRHRHFYDLTGYIDPGQYVRTELRYFLNQYKLDLMEDQGIYLELWLEKDALSRAFIRIAEKYSVPVVVCKGFSSTTFQKDYVDRIAPYIDKGKRPVILHWGDFDPSGISARDSVRDKLQNEFGVYDLQVIAGGLNIEHIQEYNLPNVTNAIKPGDSRARKHVQKYGYTAVELDALPPQVLRMEVEASIQQLIDLDKVNDRIRLQQQQREKVKGLRDQVQKLVLANI